MSGGTATRPANRQKRSIVISSDEEDDGEDGELLEALRLIEASGGTQFENTSKAKSEPLKLPSRNRTGSKGNSKSSATGKARASPSKPKKARKDEAGSRSLYTFFTAPAEQQGANIGIPLEVAEAGHDIIQDDISDDYPPAIAAATNSASHISSSNQSSQGPNLGSVPPASQRFRKAASSAKKQASGPPSAADHAREGLRRPWVDEYGPRDLEELAVHKKKVTDVRSWLDNVYTGTSRKRLLVLKGPSGSGKTTTLSLIAQAMQCEVTEWKNPQSSDSGSDGYVSISAKFEDFIARSGSFGSLQVSSDLETSSGNRYSPELKSASHRKLVLIEEFPNIFTGSSTAVKSFRSALQQYLAASIPPLGPQFSKVKSNGPIIPLVLVISETLLTTASSSADSFTVHRLLGHELIAHPGVTVIEFNPVAKTLLAKALELVILKEARKSGRTKMPGPVVLDSLGEVGDIRSAISSLEFLCLRGDKDGDWGSRIKFSKSKGKKEKPTLTKMEKESLEIVTQREASLGIFHAVGKVVYNKRDESAPATSAEELMRDESHLSALARIHPSEVAVEQLLDETGTDVQTFIAALHENYLLSCQGGNLHDFLHVTNGCLDWLSASDILSRPLDGHGGSGGKGGGVRSAPYAGTGTDELRRQELSFHVAVRGILFELPYPVKRVPAIPDSKATGPYEKSSTSGRSSAFKMFYPQSLRLWHLAEEVGELVDLWISRSHLGSLSGPSETKPRASNGGSVVESWKARVGSFSREESHAAEDPDAATAEHALLGGGSGARQEMILERLPYMAHIERGRQRLAPSTARSREMEKMTTFHGLDILKEDIPSDDEIASLHPRFRDDRTLPAKAVWPNGSEGAQRVQAEKEVGNEEPHQGDSEKLVLSEDDIEDE